jgi:hypothetical protein
VECRNGMRKCRHSDDDDDNGSVCQHRSHIGDVVRLCMNIHKIKLINHEEQKQIMSSHFDPKPRLVNLDWVFVIPPISSAFFDDE